MKNINKYLSVAVAALSMGSCADLDTEFYSDYVTTAQKEAAVEANPALAEAAVSACFSQFGSFCNQYSTDHNDFGYPALMIGLDSQTADFHSRNSGYNWFGPWEAFSSPDQDGDPTGMMWLKMYKQIRSANALLATIAPDTEDATLQFYRAQGLTTRAFDYWVLAQCYQFNYLGHEQSPCVPLITDENEADALANGAPRATVQAVYDQILSDLNGAIDCLTKCGLSPESVTDNKPKRMVSLATAYGMRARVYLTMHEYAKAATDAQAAINAFTGRPYSMEEVSVPAFTSSNEPSWMWAICIASTDRPVTSGLMNFPSMMGSFSYGYVTVGSWRWISKTLYESIPSTDVRKGWWLDENYKSDHLTPAMQEYLFTYLDPDNDVPALSSQTAFIMPNTQVKYGLYGTMGEYCDAHDVPLMRVEEMYLILAEATGMSQGSAAGAKILNDFVKQYRDPSYNCTATGDDFQEEVWRQRRIELWGEGLAYFDVMRLNKGVNRVGTNAADGFNYNIPAGDPVLIYCIPQSELTANKKISAEDNNPTSSRPTPIAQ